MATNKTKEKDYIAVRWPVTLRQQLKLAAAGHNPPMTMTDYLVGCFRLVQERGGLATVVRDGASRPPISLKRQREQFEELLSQLFATRDRELIHTFLTLLRSIVH
jgi:hypothetical protein